MAKISIDVEEITKNLKTRALSAKVQLAEMAKQAQKELAEKIEKNPRVAEIAKKLTALSDQIRARVATVAKTEKVAKKAGAKKAVNKQSDV